MQATHVSDSARPGWLARGILAGFTAAMLMLFTFVLAYVAAVVLAGLGLWDSLGLQTVRQWLIGLTQNEVIGLAQPNLYLALATHFVVGLSLGVIYARLAEPRLGGPDWKRGLIFSLVPWLLSLLVFLPLVGGGLLGLELGAGPLPILGNLILHAVYGVALGTLYGRVGHLVGDSTYAPPSGDDVPSLAHSEQSAARGILGGLVLGLFVGGAAALLIPDGGQGVFPGLGPLALVVTTALLGASFGGFIGSLAGLASPIRQS